MKHEATTPPRHYPKTPTYARKWVRWAQIHHPEAAPHVQEGSARLLAYLARSRTSDPT